MIFILWLVAQFGRAIGSYREKKPIGRGFKSLRARFLNKFFFIVYLLLFPEHLFFRQYPLTVKGWVVTLLKVPHFPIRKHGDYLVSLSKQDHQ